MPVRSCIRSPWSPRRSRFTTCVKQHRDALSRPHGPVSGPAPGTRCASGPRCWELAKFVEVHMPIGGGQEGTTDRQRSCGTIPTFPVQEKSLCFGLAFLRLCLIDLHSIAESSMYWFPGGAVALGNLAWFCQAEIYCLGGMWPEPDVEFRPGVPGFGRRAVRWHGWRSASLSASVYTTE